MKLGTSIPSTNETCLPNLSRSPCQWGSYETLNCPWGQFWRSVFIAAKWFGGSRLFLVGAYRWTTATPTPKRDHFYPKGELWGPEILGYKGRYRRTLNYPDEIWHRSAPDKGNSRLPNFGLIAIRLGVMGPRYFGFYGNV